MSKELTSYSSLPHFIELIPHIWAHLGKVHLHHPSTCKTTGTSVLGIIVQFHTWALKNQSVKTAKSDTKDQRTSHVTVKSPPLCTKTGDTQTNKSCLPYSLKAAEERRFLSISRWSGPSFWHFPRYLEEMETWIPSSEHSSLAARILHAPAHTSGERLPQSTNSVPLCSPAWPASTTLPKGKPPAEVQAPSPHPTKKSVTHTAPEKNPSAKLSLTCLAVNSGGDKACLPRSWGMEQLQLYAVPFQQSGYKITFLYPYRCANTAAIHVTLSSGQCNCDKTGVVFFRLEKWKWSSKIWGFDATKKKCNW